MLISHRYNIKEYRRHGEAASVDQKSVKEERSRLNKLLDAYPPEDILNFDESSLFAFAPPDRGLATKQMSGKKSSKFRITLGFAVSATGEKFPPFFIGKYKKPRCFGKVGPNERNFYYRNNSSAWMTSELFEESVYLFYRILIYSHPGRWIKSMDARFRKSKRKVILLVDNFSGHTIKYVPTNMRIEFFEPNMTPFVQPLDAGVIRCFKACYRRQFCYRAIEMDDAGEEDVYKIDLLQGMLMARKAWDEVSTDTIQNCWRHTGILPARCAEADGTE